MSALQTSPPHPLPPFHLCLHSLNLKVLYKSSPQIPISSSSSLGGCLKRHLPHLQKVFCLHTIKIIPPFLEQNGISGRIQDIQAANLIFPGRLADSTQIFMLQFEINQIQVIHCSKYCKLHIIIKIPTVFCKIQVYRNSLSQ